MNKFEIPGDILQEALIQYQIERIESQYPSPEECNERYALYPKTEAKIEKLIIRQEKPYYIYINTLSKRVAVILIVCILSLTATVFSVKALRDPVINFIVEVAEKFSTVIFGNENKTDSYPVSIETINEPSYIPEGFVTEEKINDRHQFKVTYDGGEHGKIVFFQYTMAATQFIIDTEDAVTENVQIGEYHGLFYSKRGFNSLVWDDGKYGYYIRGAIDKEIILEMAKSIKNSTAIG